MRWKAPGQGMPDQKDWIHATSTTTSAPSGTSKAPPQKPPSTNQQAPSPTSNKSVRIDDNPQVENIPSRATTSSSEAVPDIKEVLADVGKMLKAMQAPTTFRKLNATSEVENEQEHENPQVKSVVYG